MARLYWSCWVLASVTTGLVAGFMLGHARILGRFIDWMLATDPRLLASTYPVFASSAGRGGLTMFYAICGLQVIAAPTLLGLALGTRRHLRAATIAALAAVLWPIVHYASGFGALEAMVLRSTTPVPPEVAARFRRARGRHPRRAPPGRVARPAGDAAHRRAAYTRSMRWRTCLCCQPPRP
jgi:hypothetical protein